MMLGFYSRMILGMSFSQKISTSMVTSICRPFLVHRDNSFVVKISSSKTLNHPHFRLHAFTSKSAIHNDFAADYLVSKLGLTPEKAFSASKYLKVKSSENPDSVVAFLQSNGFTVEQIATMVRKCPRLITCDPRKTLLPKIDFFRSSGVSETDVISAFVLSPQLFTCSLERQIVPKFDYLKTIFGSKGASLESLKGLHRLAHIFLCDFGSQLVPNVEVLREAGVGYSEILSLMKYQPRAFMVDKERFKDVVEEVKRMGFSPSGSRFVTAVHVLRSMSKSTWENKLGVYMKWGWSRDDCISAFMKQPCVMVKSVDHIMKVMDFLVNKMGFHSLLVSKSPSVLTYSFEKRVKPRGSVYMFLWEKGLKKKGYCIPSFSQTERDFVKSFVLRFEDEAPELLKLYEKEMGVLKSQTS